MKLSTLEKLYTNVAPVAGAAPPDLQRAVGHFDLFRIDDLMAGYGRRPPMDFQRQGFYKISLVCGHSRVEYADYAIDIESNSLFLATPRVPYRWLPLAPDLTGYFCVFTEEFLLPTKGGLVLAELPIFGPSAHPVVALTDAECTAVAAIFEKMARELAADYAYKYDLLRTYLLELIHAVQKLQPAPTTASATPPAAARVAARFGELLEQQFPLGGPPPQRLRTAKDYADQLAVHVNHLNRVLKETTGHTTTALIANRVAQEAKLLLKQPTHTISEIADHLGFADAAHFCTFFKRRTGLTPGDFRA